jgi:hypothetical protein
LTQVTAAAAMAAATVDRMSGQERPLTSDHSHDDVPRESVPGAPRHLAPDDAGERPFIDLSRDPTPGKPDHAAPEDDPDEDQEG